MMTKHYDAPRLTGTISKNVKSFCKRWDETRVDAFVDIHGDVALPLEISWLKVVVVRGPRLQHLLAWNLFFSCSIYIIYILSCMQTPDNKCKQTSFLQWFQEEMFAAIKFVFASIVSRSRWKYRSKIAYCQIQCGIHPARSMMLGSSLSFLYTRICVNRESFGKRLDAYIRPKETNDEKAGHDGV
mmetsp:Transcript_306/g.460  ORF Transcript_306/g.460 Transcript_306/m.460 type:complete len:185 (+) Transcript_306:75-629(+)